MPRFKKELIKGISWMGALRAFTRGLGIVKIAILARLLTPSQFGIFGIAVLILGFLEIATETGVNVFLIQEKNRLREFLDSAWVVSIFRGLLIALMLFLLVPIITSFFNAPSARNILYLTCLIPIIRGFINPAVVKFQIELAFNKEFFKEAVLVIVDTSFAILLGIVSRSENALIWSMLIASFIEVIISFIFISPKPMFRFNLNQVKKIINRGKWVTGSGMLDYIFTHFDDVVVGKVLGTFFLGLYQNAYKISTLFVIETQHVFNKVSFPLYSTLVEDKISPSDKRNILKSFTTVTIAITIICLPLGFLFVLFSKQIIILLLGENWLGATQVLQILVIYAVLKAIINSANPLLLAYKMQRAVAIITLVSTAGLVITIFPLIKSLGMSGAGISTIVGTLLGVPFVIYYLKKVFT